MTSSIEIADIDRYIDGTMTPSELASFEARKQSDAKLGQNIVAQSKMRRMITLHGRMHLRESLERIHRELFEGQAHLVFRETVMSYFK